MTSAVQQSPQAEVDRRPALDEVVFMLRATGKLWAAPDLDTLAVAAIALMQELVPGTVVDRCRVGLVTQVVARCPGRTLAIKLSELEVLVVIAQCDEDYLLLQLVAESVEARVHDLAERMTLKDSVERLGRSERLQRALYAIADQASVADTSLATMFQALHQIVGTLMYAENFYIALYDSSQDSVTFPYFADSADSEPAFPPPETPTGDASPQPVWRMADIPHGPTWHLIRGGLPLMGPGESLGRQVTGHFQSSGSTCVDFLGVPLLDGNDVVGCVAVQSYDEAHHYDDQDKALLTFVAQHIQTALERRIAHAELERRVAERTEALRDANRGLQQQVLERQRGERLQAALFHIAELASTTDSMEDFYAATHRVVGGLLYARNFYIALLSDDGAHVTFPYWVDERNDNYAPRELSLDQGITEYVLRKGTALLADEGEIERLYTSGAIKQSSNGSTYWLGVPLICDERTVGVLAVQSYSREYHYTQRDQELLTFVSYHIANALARIRAKESLQQTLAQLEVRVEKRTRELALANRDLRSEISERERIEARLKHDALHDSLTNLPNRALFIQRLTQALTRYHDDPSRGFAVLFMDLDRFKVINDSEGHLVGDDLLIQAGARIRARLKAEDVVARLGGDEFGVLLEGVHDMASACQIAERIIAGLNAPFRLATKELFTSASIGVTLAAPHYRSPDELLRDADSAMYRAKADGRHRCMAFDDNLRRKAVSLLEVESDLRRGLTRNEFVPFYQPIVSLENGQVVGYEALMRWRHPRRGLLLPGAFLDVAEDTGAAETIDWQIFMQVCRDANALVANNDLFVAINLTARHFDNPQFERHLFDLLAEYAVPASCLCVEVTERALLESTPPVKRALQAFRRAGIGIALDDFGTGYSSLSYMNRYPLQTLKIDRSFIANLGKDAAGGSDAVIRAILAMAAALSLRVVAEGVETHAQRDMLRELGCRYAQGFLYAKPQPLDTWIGRDAALFLAG